MFTLCCKLFSVSSSWNVEVLYLISFVRRQKGLTGYCFKYTDRPFCLRASDMLIGHELR